MKREEAIRKLQKQKLEYLEEWVDFSGVAEAYDMAIKALSAEAIQLKQTDTLIIATALQYLIEDKDRHELDRASAKKLREQILKLGASMCADAASQSEQYKKGFEDAKRVFLVKYIKESENMRKRNAQLEVMLNAQKAILAEAAQVNDSLINKQDTINAIENTDIKLTKKDWDELMDAINTLPLIEAAPKWIPIEEQLPENGFDDVVLVSIGYDVEFGRCNSNGEWLIWSNSEWVQCDKVLAWIPLPEPYKGGED